jgi:hypothetical protein
MDDMIPRSMAIRSYQRIRDLAALHDTMTVVEDPDCAHGISHMSIGAFSAFLKARLNLKHELENAEDEVMRPEK